MDYHISDFTTNRFARLRDYFVGIKVKEFFAQFGGVSPAAWNSFFEPKDRMLAHIFFEKVLLPVRNLIDEADKIRPDVNSLLRINDRINEFRTTNDYNSNPVPN